jgi:magnesium-transporting ATPase (P-type)
MNKMLWCVLIIQFILCLASAAASTAWERQINSVSLSYIPRSIGDKSWYLTKDVSAGVIFVSRIFTYLVLYATMVPISLYVTLEIVRVSQVLFIEWDLKMFDEEKNTGASCKTSNLNEELGQIQFLFSDKTGTLTSNQMTLKRISITGHKMEVEKYEESSTFEEKLFWLVVTVCHSALPTKDKTSCFASL